MDDQSKHIRFFTGSLIEIQRLQIDLDEKEIPSMTERDKVDAEHVWSMCKKPPRISFRHKGARSPEM